MIKFGSVVILCVMVIIGDFMLAKCGSLAKSEYKKCEESRILGAFFLLIAMKDALVGTNQRANPHSLSLYYF